MDKELAGWPHPKSCSQQLQGYELRIMRQHCRIKAEEWTLTMGEACSNSQIYTDSSESANAEW